MTNEEIFVLFLKKHRKFKYVKENLGLGLKSNHLTAMENIPVNIAVKYLFMWHLTKQGFSYWDNLEGKWMKLVKQFKLEGNINLRELEKFK